MEVLHIIILLLITGVVLWGYATIWVSINEHCSKKYGGFKPLGSSSVAICAVASIAIWIGGYFIIEGGGFPHLPWGNVFFHSHAFNGLMGVCFGLIIGLLLYIYLWSQTSLLAASLSMLMLTIAGACVALAILFLIFLTIAALSGSRRKVYVIE